MRLDDYINNSLDDIEIPDELQPDNIARMLKIKTAEKNKKPIVDIKAQKRTFVFRTVSAVAACSVMALGVAAMLNIETNDIPAGYIENAGQIKTAEDYSVVYKAFQNSVIKNNGDVENKRNVIEITPDSIEKPVEKPEPPKQTGTTDEGKVTEYKVTGDYIQDNDIADILQSDGENIFYIANNAIYSIKKNSGEIAVESKEYKSNLKPLEMYINGDKLIVISSSVDDIPYEIHTNKEEASTITNADDRVKPVTEDASATNSAEVTEEVNPDSESINHVNSQNIPSKVEQKNTVVGIYDKNTLKEIIEYKQNGSYISSDISGESLYVVTNYSDFQSKPLEKENDLDNYVPSYSVNGKKYYVEANDILIPGTADATGYTVAAGLNVQAENPVVSVKAVVGSGNYVKSYDDSIYVIGNNYASKNVTATSIVKFSCGNGNLIYNASNAFEGVLVSPESMDKYDNSFRIATKVSDRKAKKSYININIVDENLNLMGSITNLAENKDVTGVKFYENSALISFVDSANPLEIDLTDKTIPKIPEKATANSKLAYLNKIGDKYLSIITLEYDDGKKPALTRISLLDANLTELSKVEIEGAVADVNSTDCILNKNKVYADAEKSILGIPTVEEVEYGIKTTYTIFTVTDKLEKKCSIDYSEISEAHSFNRAFVDNGILYVMSSSRIVSYDLNNMKVIDTVQIK